jgi:hypothetical protein
MHSLLRHSLSWPCLLLTLLLALGFTSGCTTYREKPVELDDFAAHWQSRSAEHDDLQKYVAQLREQGVAAATTFSSADGIDLREAEIMALYFSPRLHALRVQAGISRIDAENAGRWDDPIIGVDA